MIDYAVLETELLTDPRAYGYGPLIVAGNDEALADLLNERRAGITIRRADITPAELLEAVDTRDIGTLTAGQSAYFESVLQAPRLRISTDAGGDTRLKNNLDRLLGNTNGSQARLNALAVRTGSRAEELFGGGITVSFTDIALALRG